MKKKFSTLKISYLVLLIVSTILTVPIISSSETFLTKKTSHPIRTIKSENISILFSTLISGNLGEHPWMIVLDSDENLVIVGTTKSNDFPTTENAYDEDYNGYSGFHDKGDVYVCKLSADGSELLFGTYIGGTKNEVGTSMVLDSLGNIIIVGATSSTDFPTTTDAFNSTYNGDSGGEHIVNGDGFISKLSADGSELLYSTFLGGSNDDYIYSMAQDSGNNIIIAGGTSSSDFPTTHDAINSTYNGHGTIVDGYEGDLFFSKLSGDGSELLYSSFLGGSNNEYGGLVEVDNQDNIYLVGLTESNDFPTTPNAYDSDYNGSGDVVACKISADGSELEYSTFLGGSGKEHFDIGATVDDTNILYIAGGTESSDFPTTANAYDQSYNGDSSYLVDYKGDVFISRLSADGSNLLYSTYIGGSNDEFVSDIELDDANNIYLIGGTHSDNFPTITTSRAEDRDAFVVVLAADGSNIEASTSLSGNEFDYGAVIILDKLNNIFVAGGTYSHNFPTTVGPSHKEEYDTFVCKLEAVFEPITTTTTTATTINTTTTTTTTPETGSSIDFLTVVAYFVTICTATLFIRRKKK
jgi:hypothetical protein